jgi:hypothetical protein
MANRAIVSWHAGDGSGAERREDKTRPPARAERELKRLEQRKQEQEQNGGSSTKDPGKSGH